MEPVPLRRIAGSARGPPDRTSDPALTRRSHSMNGSAGLRMRALRFSMAGEHGVRPWLLCRTMLIFGGGPERPQQIGRPFPPILYGLVKRRRHRAELHAVGCELLESLREQIVRTGGEIVWSTTYDEIEDHAARQFGEDGWDTCPACHAINKGNVR
jgi:hypothetical protein